MKIVKLFALVSAVVLLSMASSQVARADGLRFIEAKSLEEAIKTANDENMILMVEMFRVNCPACVRIETKVFPSDLVGDELNGAIVGFRINGEEGYGIDLMKKYRVTAFPTLLLFKDGKLIERSIGSSDTPEAFIERIHSLLQNYDVF